MFDFDHKNSQLAASDVCKCLSIFQFKAFKQQIYFTLKNLRLLVVGVISLVSTHQKQNNYDVIAMVTLVQIEQQLNSRFRTHRHNRFFGLLHLVWIEPRVGLSTLKSKYRAVRVICDLVTVTVPKSVVDTVVA